MNVFYVGPYRQSDGWGLASRSLAKIISQQEDVDLTCRPIWYNLNSLQQDIGSLEACENKKLEKKETLIQFGLPQYLNYNGDFKRNIAATIVDCRVDNMSWVANLNLFDEILVFSKNEKTMLEKSGIKGNIHNLNALPIELDDTATEFDTNEFESRYTFYTNAGLATNSGLRETIVAFLSSFTALDNQILIIFCNEKNSQQISEEIELIKKSLNIFANMDDMYPRIGIIKAEDQSLINHGHSVFDCFIDLSYNLSLNYQIIHAFSKNRPVILLDTCKDQIGEDYELLVKSIEEPSFTQKRPINGMYSGEHTWSKPKIQDIKNKMISVSTDNTIADKLKEIIYKFNSNYSFSNNQKIKEILCMQ